MIKKIKIELIFITILILSIIIFPNLDAKFSYFFNNAGYLNNVYLKKFFVNITEIGDSSWIFLLAVLGFCLSYILKKITGIKIFDKLKNISSLLFFSSLTAGIITQLIKHLIGRPRPNQSDIIGSFNISPFSFESTFHSFPSGHTASIFVIALVLGSLTPKIKYFYFAFASLVALSRVVVGAHYFADILGGVVVGWLGYKLTLAYLNKKNMKDSFLPIKKINDESFFLILIVFFIGVIFVSIGSAVDIFISDLFYYGQQTFVLQSYYLITIIARKFLLPFLIVYIFVLPFLSSYQPFKTIYFSYKFNFRELLLIFLSAFINLAVIINLVLKNFWGRARPNDVLEFGGMENFTPWFQFSNACESNCSFVSGDSAVGFSIIMLYFVTKLQAFLWLSLFMGFFLGVIRILEGGHFFSDILMSGFFVFVLSYGQYYFYIKKIKR